VTYEALIVDYGGVLTEPMQDIMARFAGSLGIDPQDLARAALIVYVGGEDDLVPAYETGQMADDEFGRLFAARLTEITGVQIRSHGLIGRLFEAVKLEEEMLGAIRSARASGLKTGMLSNSWGVGYYPRDLLDELFDAVVISGEVGLRKPDPEIFTLTAEKLGVAPERCVFVDDHPGHLKAAGELGMTTVLHRTPAETISELDELLHPRSSGSS
jgi:putative hydrolase of the HAD superfamily